jgi:hypothetical protein
MPLPDMPEPAKVAASAYEVYREAFPEVAESMPDFDELPDRVKDAWAVVAAKILTYAPEIATHPESAAHPQETPQ